jgi:hypothetical protein
MKKLFNRFFSPQLSFRLTLFNIISTVGLIGGLISFGVSLANGLPAIQDAVVFCSILMLAYCLYLANFKDRLKAASIIIISLITMVLLPIMFITGGGVYGGMPSWFVIGIVFTFLLIDGRLCLDPRGDTDPSVHRLLYGGLLSSGMDHAVSVQVGRFHRCGAEHVHRGLYAGSHHALPEHGL